MVPKCYDQKQRGGLGGSPYRAYALRGKRSNSWRALENAPRLHYTVALPHQLQLPSLPRTRTHGRTRMQDALRVLPTLSRAAAAATAAAAASLRVPPPLSRSLSAAATAAAGGGGIGLRRRSEFVVRPNRTEIQILVGLVGPPPSHLMGHYTVAKGLNLSLTCGAHDLPYPHLLQLT